MGFLFTILRIISYFLILCMATLCLACGLYYIAELIEEHEKTTKKILKFSILGVLATHLLMIMELPFLYLFVGAAAHAFYYILLQQYPRVKLNSFAFVVSIVLFFVSHYLWFSYFTSMFFVFWDILAFFLICVWLVPFIFFISLTSDDNNLPNVYGSVAATGEAIEDGSKKHGNRIVLFFQKLLQDKDKWLETMWPTKRGYKTF